ncbi:hypothetical protein MUK42_34346 [Musa troglodytarum]|uniref:Uncharacterized protein n=1 Tax=Musa troglodytarum TaxID=320322 RepID=A0A9E7KCX4_9LILI|nr:hypothetical protein MUK42_34346 [Musa troglodytarum]
MSITERRAQLLGDLFSSTKDSFLPLYTRGAAYSSRPAGRIETIAGGFGSTRALTLQKPMRA